MNYQVPYTAPKFVDMYTGAKSAKWVIRYFDVPAATICEWIDNSVKCRARDCKEEGRELPPRVTEGMSLLKGHLLAGRLREAQKLIKSNAYVNGYLTMSLRDDIMGAKKA